MPDDAALRNRRSRMHRAGDHSLCRPDRCERAQAAVVAAEPAPPPPVPGETPAGGIEMAVQAYVEALPFQATDPRALLGQIAISLARRVDQTGAMPAAVRELRVLLVQLIEVPNGPAGQVDELRMRAAQRRLDAILAHAAA